MKSGAAAFALILSGCGTVQWVRAPEVSDAECGASCNAHYDQCPQVFAGFPERAAVECPAEYKNCQRVCAKMHPPARTVAAPMAAAEPPSVTGVRVSAPPPAAAGAAVAAAPADAPHAVASKEARLRELKHFHDEGLITEDVYRDRQKAILAEP